MKYLKINLDEEASAEKMIELLTLVKGIKSVEIIGENASESDLKKALNKSRNQLKSGDYESIVNDVFDLLLTPRKSK